MKAITRIEEIAKEIESGSEVKNVEKKNNELLESVEGLSWSLLVFDELEWRIEDARDELVL